MKVFPKRKRTFCSKPVKRIDQVKWPFFNRILFVLNFIVAFLLLVVYLAQFLSVNRFPFLTILSLTTPLLTGLNLLFLAFWIIRRRRPFFLSLVVLLIAYFSFGTFYKFRFGNSIVPKDDLKVMSYNVRNFRRLGILDGDAVYKNVKDIIARESPDIICFQEIKKSSLKDYKAYPYKSLKYAGIPRKEMLGIFSKYPIVRAGIIPFPESYNNAAFADVRYKNDTIRIYSVHLESLGFKKNTRSQSSSDGHYTKLAKSFIKQAEQAQIILEHSDKISYPKIVCGDFNNTQFSKVYRLIKGQMNDTYLKQGSGFGRTYHMKRLPIRIDFILADPEFEVRSHKNFEERISDHFPIMASFRLKKN